MSWLNARCLMKSPFHGNRDSTIQRFSHQEHVCPAPHGSPPGRLPSPAAPLQLLQPCSGIDIYNYLSPSPWQPGPLASSTGGSRTEPRGGRAPGHGDPRLQRPRGKAPAPARQVPGFFLESRPHLGTPRPGVCPRDCRPAAAPCWGLCPGAETARHSCCCSKCKIPPS